MCSKTFPNCYTFLLEVKAETDTGIEEKEGF